MNNKLDKFFRTKYFGIFLGVYVVAGLALAILYNQYKFIYPDYLDRASDIYAFLFFTVIIIGLLNPLFYKKEDK